MASSMDYQFNVLYNEARFKQTSDTDTELSLEVTEHLVTLAESWGYSKSYYAGRDVLPGQDKYDEHFLVIEKSVFTFVVITPEFHENKWAMYKQKAGFDYLMNKDKDGFVYGIAVGVERLPMNMCLTNFASFRKEDWKSDEKNWNKIRKMMDRHFRPKYAEKSEHSQLQSAVNLSTTEPLSVDGVPENNGIMQEQSVYSSSKTAPSGSQSWTIGTLNLNVGKNLTIQGDAFSSKSEVRTTGQSDLESKENYSQLPMEVHGTSLEDSETTIRMKTLHREMIQKLQGYIYPSSPYWDNFCNMMKIHLVPAEINSCANVFDVCEILLIRGIIKYGDYAFLTMASKEIGHALCCDIIEEYTKKINDIQRVDKDFMDSMKGEGNINMQSVTDKCDESSENENYKRNEESRETFSLPVSEAIRINNPFIMQQLPIQVTEKDQKHPGISSYEKNEGPHTENADEGRESIAQMSTPSGESGIGSSLSTSPDKDGTDGQEKQPERLSEPADMQTNRESKIFRFFSIAFQPLCHIWNRVEQPYF